MVPRRAYQSPHALHNERTPLGPRRMRGVECAVHPQFEHARPFFLPFSPPPPPPPPPLPRVPPPPLPPPPAPTLNILGGAGGCGGGRGGNTGATPALMRRDNSTAMHATASFVLVAPECQRRTCVVPLTIITTTEFKPKLKKPLFQLSLVPFKTRTADPPNKRTDRVVCTTDTQPTSSDRPYTHHHIYIVYRYTNQVLKGHAHVCIVVHTRV